MADRLPLGVLELMRESPHTVGAADIEMLSMAAMQLGQFLAHHRVVEERDWFFNLSTDLLGIAGFDGILA